MATTADLMAPGNYPLLSVHHIEDPNRFWAIPVVGIVAKGIILIPVGIWLYLLSLAVIVVSIINSLMVFFTGKYWGAAYGLGLGVLRLETKAWFFLMGLTNRYPGF